MTRITTGDMMHVHGGFDSNVDYTVRLTVRMDAPVDADVLRGALEKTQRRYPYLCVRMRRGGDAFTYEENHRPVVLLQQEERVRLNEAETNFHAWAVCCAEDRIHLDFYHGLTDGTGMYRVLATLLHHYCAARYGETAREGVWTAEEPAAPEETADPQDTIPAPDPMPAPAPMAEAFTLDRDGGLTRGEATIWDVEIPEDAFIAFTSANDASPGTMVSVLMARAIDGLYPGRDKDIVSAYVVNARPMLRAEKTHHNCLTMALFPYSDRVRAMPFTWQCTAYRGMTFIQSDEDRVAPAMAANAALIRAAAESAPTAEAKMQVFGPAFRGGEGVVTFLVSYTGQWKHPALGRHMRELWAHPPDTFGLMVEVGAAGGKIFLTIQQQFREDTVREAFLRQLEENGVPYALRRVMPSDVAVFRAPPAEEE